MSRVPQTLVSGVPLSVSFPQPWLENQREFASLILVTEECVGSSELEGGWKRLRGLPQLSQDQGPDPGPQDENTAYATNNKVYHPCI